MCPIGLSIFGIHLDLFPELNSPSTYSTCMRFPPKLGGGMSQWLCPSSDISLFQGFPQLQELIYYIHRIPYTKYQSRVSCGLALYAMNPEGGILASAMSCVYKFLDCRRYILANVSLVKYLSTMDSTSDVAFRTSCTGVAAVPTCWRVIDSRRALDLPGLYAWYLRSQSRTHARHSRSDVMM